MFKPTRPLRRFALIGGLALAGCAPSDPPKPAGPPLEGAAKEGAAPAPAPDGETTYDLKGVVRAIDPAKGQVTIDHEAIPGFMGAMAMPFELADKRLLEDLRVGDVVHGPLVVRREEGKLVDYRIADLTVTGVAPAAPARSSLPVPVAAEPLKVGELVPDFAMTMQDGTSARLSDLRGKAVALTFIYTRCPLPDFCPASDAKFAEAARRVAVKPGRSEGARLISVSFDPDHDTPEVLRKHAEMRGARPPLWSFAVSNGEELAKVGSALGLDYYPQSGQFAHNLIAAVIGPDGRLAWLDRGKSWTGDDVASAIIGLEKAGGANALPPAPKDQQSNGSTTSMREVMPTFSNP